MAQPKPDYLAQPKYLELAEAYNAIEHKRYGSFQLRALAKKAEHEYRAQGDLAAGLVWATCLFDMGKSQTSEEAFKELTAKIPLDPDDELSINLYIVYARILAFTGHVQEALPYLDRLLGRMPELGLATIHVVAGIYTDAGQYEKAMSLLNLTQENPDSQLEGESPIWPLLVYHWSKGDIDTVIDLLNTFAKHTDLEELTLQNLDAVMDGLASCLIEPNFKPDLTVGEIKHLEAIHAMVLKSNHLQETHPAYFDDDEAMVMLEDLMDDYDKTFRELAL